MLAHQACARRVRLLARSGQCDAAAAALLSYANLYTAVVASDKDSLAAPPWMLRGRLFQQALTEAVWAVSIGDAAWCLAESGVGDLAAALPLLDSLEEFVHEARAELIARGQFRSNYTAWLIAAGAVCSGAAALVRGQRRSLTWLDSESGLYAHVLAATLPDGWEWEGSTYYHGFVLRGYLLALRGIAPDAIPPAVLRRLQAMAHVLRSIACADGRLPALHDGPYRRADLGLEWLELAALAGLPEIASGASGDARGVRDDLETYLRPSLPKAQTTRRDVFEDAGYAVLRTHGLQAMVDFGPHGGSHGHRDKLALYLYGDHDNWQPDPGQVPYGHAGWRDYYRSSRAHPTFSVDELEQAECSGRLAESADDAITIEVDGAYPGVTAVRHVECRADGLLVDVLAVEAARPRRIALHLRPDVPLDLRLDGDLIRSVWPGTVDLHGAHVVDVACRPFVRPGPGPADDPQRERPHVDLVTEPVERAVFMSAYRAAVPISSDDIERGLRVAARWLA